MRPPPGYLFRVIVGWLVAAVELTVVHSVIVHVVTFMTPKLRRAPHQQLR